MKKLLAICVALFISAEALFAVPSGVYCDNRGNRKVLVQGNTIYCLDSDGNVTRTFEVVQENSDGSFLVKIVVNGQPYGYPVNDNAWWSENGKIYLNLANQPRTLVRE